jgi:cell division protein FtsQ
MLLVGGMAGTSLFLILVYDAVTQSPYFKARTITVEGNQRLSKDTILKQAGLGLHDNILFVNLNTLRYKLIAHPWVAAAEIERQLPDVIHICVKERVPIAIVELNRFSGLADTSANRLPANSNAGKGGQFAMHALLSSGAKEQAGAASRLFYIDEEGEIFKPVERSDNLSVPLVTGLTLSDIDFNDQSRSRLFRSVMEALRLSRLHKNVVPLRALHSIHVDREMGLTLFAFFVQGDQSAARGHTIADKAGRNTVAIKVGFGEYESKYSRLGEVVPYLKKKSWFLNLESIDLSDSDRVVVRPSQAGRAGIRSIAAGSNLWPSILKEV